MPKRYIRIVFLAVLVLALPEPTMLGSPASGTGRTAPSALPAGQLAAQTGGSFTLMSEGFALYPLGMDWVDNSWHGQWRDRYGGYGKVGIAVDSSRVLSESPKAATRQSETHAGLVTSLRSFGDLNLTLNIKTIKQLRTPRPNPWEMAWVLWHYANNTHFYYLILKTNGWELGKEDPAYPGNQRFLLTQSYPRFRPGAWYSVHIRQVGATITMWVGRTKLGTFTDRQRPYTWGSLGLYCEDSRVEFDNITVTLP